VLFGKKKTLGRERTAVLFCVGLAGYLAWNLKLILQLKSVLPLKKVKSVLQSYFIFN